MIPSNPLSGFGQIEGVDLVNQCWEPFQADPYGNCPTVTCDPDCGSNGIATLYTRYYRRI